MLESELVKAKAKGKVIGIFKFDLDNKKYKINLLEKKLDKEKAKAKRNEAIGIYRLN
jgi:predicted RNA-binding protein with PUA domain